MSRITGLPIKAPLKKQIVRRAEVKDYLTRTLHAEMTPDEIHTQEAALKAFGLVGPDFNLEEFLLAFYTEQAAGAYDVREKTMLIADWPSPDMQRLALAHELTHVLQDQNFDMRKFLRARKGDDDATAARQAISEGHAMAAMLQYTLGPLELAKLPSLEPLMSAMVAKQMAEFPVFANAPFFFRFAVLFPYSQGMSFMQHGMERGGWKALNGLFRRPPSTTKEIFEPQLYFEPKPLPRVSLPRPEALERAGALRLLGENIMGQLGYYSLLGQLISEEEAKRVATAWLADRYVLYEYEGVKPNQYALVARTRWTSPATALAFFQDYHEILRQKYPALARDDRSTDDCFVGKAANGAVLMLRRRDECVWAEGVRAAEIDAMLKWLQSL